MYKEDAYFTDAFGKHVLKEEALSGTVRPFGMGPRVPMYVVSPWSKGGWVNAQVFDHTSVGQFLEARFGVHIPGISAWHRAVSGDLTSCFDFAKPNDASFPALPAAKDSVQVVMGHVHRRPVSAPKTPEPLTQEPGNRPSRALPYVLDVAARCEPSQGKVSLDFRNLGKAGAVFHVYDHRHLDLIPRRYTVEAGKSLADAWAADGGAYHLWVLGPNGFVREFKGMLAAQGQAQPEIAVAYDARKRTIALTLSNTGAAPCTVSLRHNAYRPAAAQDIALAPRRPSRHQIALADSFDWYDLTVSGDGFERRLAGRLETGAHGVSDPATAV